MVQQISMDRVASRPLCASLILGGIQNNEYIEELSYGQYPCYL